MRKISVAVAMAAVVLSAPAAARGQSLDSTMMMANAAEAANDFARAARLYERFYHLSGFDPGALAAAAVAAARAGQDSLALAYFGTAIGRGYLNAGFLDYVDRDTALARMRRLPGWIDLLAYAKRLAAALDQPLRVELLNIAERDQQNRRQLGAMMERYGRASPQGDSAARALERDDAPLLARVREIVRTTGWPSAHRVGDDGAHAAWLVIQHAPAVVQRELLPSIRAVIRSGGGRLGDLALLEDVVLIADGHPQMYGTRLRYSVKGGPSTLEPIFDEPCVDERRATMGLEPLRDYLRRMGVAYTPPSPPCVTRASAPKEVHAVRMTPSSVSLGVNESIALVASVMADAAVDDRTVIWRSTNPAIATVDAYGKVTGVSNGTTTIVAIANGNPRVQGATVVNVR